MKYSTYKKLHEKMPLYRRFFLLTVAVVLVILFVVALALTQRSGSATAATSESETGQISADAAFEPIDCTLPEELQEYTYYLCRSSDLDFCLVMAVMFMESGFDVYAESTTGDIGLMQINEIALPELTDKLWITNIADPYQNIRAGVYIISEYMSRYDALERVLMSYNMGEYGAASLWDSGVCSTTYTAKVLTKYAEFKEANYGKR